MYAVIEDSGKQYKVAKGDVINVDVRPLPAGADTLEFDKVLLVGGDAGAKIGSPVVAGAKVKAKLTKTAQPAAREGSQSGTEGVFNVKGLKLDVWHVRRRKNRSRKMTGHRQKYLQVTISEITA
jgi:large subunit ribosomal protein L21